MIDIHLDCDPGHDDAVAMAVADKLGKLRSISTVFGNDTLAAVTQNALIAVEELEIDVEIYRGAVGPFQSCGESSPTPLSAFIEMRRPRRALATESANESAHQAIISTCANWLVATGPLTNVAMALLDSKDLAARLDGISFMGGSVGPGNVTASAEFNIWSDPEAAAVVLAAGCEIRMVGLEATHRALVGHDLAVALRCDTGPGNPFLGRLLSEYIDGYPDAFTERPVAPLHDPCAVLAVTNPELFDWREVDVQVELGGTLDRGATIIDTRSGSSPGAVQVAVDLDGQAAIDVVAEALLNDPPR